jgi:hypothetical protein
LINTVGAMTSSVKFLAVSLALSEQVVGRVSRFPQSEDQSKRDADNLISTATSGNVIRNASGIQSMKPLRQRSVDAAERNAMAPSDEDVLYWTGEGGTVAELRIKTPGESEAVVNAERFSELIESLDCGAEGSGQISVRFTEKADFDNAADVWQWVAEGEENHFLLVVGAGDCAWNEERQLFRVDNLSYVDETETAVLRADAVTWKEALHSFDLTIGKAASNAEASRLLQGSDSEIDAQASPDFTVPFEADISGQSIGFSLEGVDFTGTCAQCTVSGVFEVDVKFSVGFFELDEAAVVVTTPGINVVGILQATIVGETTTILPEQSFPLFEFQPAGFSIPGIVEIGPTISLVVKAGVTSVKGTVTLTLGGTAAIPASTATLDFLDEEGTTAEGWTPTFEPVPLSVDALVEVSASAALLPTLKLEVSALDYGYVAQVTGEAPSLDGALSAISSSTCEACGQYQNAVEGSLILGAVLTAAVQELNDGTPEDLWSRVLYDADLPPLVSFCEAIGPQQCAASAN